MRHLAPPQPASGSLRFGVADPCTSSVSPWLQTIDRWVRKTRTHHGTSNRRRRQSWSELPTPILSKRNLTEGVPAPADDQLPSPGPPPASEGDARVFAEL